MYCSPVSDYLNPDDLDSHQMAYDDDSSLGLC